MRILLVMLFGFVLVACDKSYEKEYIALLGTDINQMEGIDDYEFIVRGGFKHYTKKTTSDDGAEVAFFVAEDLSCIQTVSFKESRYDLGKGYFNDEMSKLLKKYGDPKRINLDDWDDWDYGDVEFLVEGQPYSNMVILHIYNNDKTKGRIEYIIITNYSKDCQ